MTRETKSLQMKQTFLLKTNKYLITSCKKITYDALIKTFCMLVYFIKMHISDVDSAGDLVKVLDDYG